MQKPIPQDIYFRDMEQFAGSRSVVFSRAGAWLTLSSSDARYGRGELFLNSYRGMHAHGRVTEGTKLYQIHPTYEGKKVAFAVHLAEAAELTLRTRYGCVRFTWGETGLLLAEGDPGMGLEWTRTAAPYEAVKQRADGAWESTPRFGTPLIFKGLAGSRFAFDDTWNWFSINSGAILGRTYPGPDGRFTMAVDEKLFIERLRESWPTYAEAKANAQADWEAFLAKIPHFPAPYEDGRVETAYVLWSNLVAPTALTPYWMMMMFPGEIDSAWQLVQNGVALQDNVELSRNLLLSPLERQGADGQIAENYDEAFIFAGSVKPPIFGWALKNVMSHHDLAAEWPREDLEKLYERAGKWADWFMLCRDDDKDGLPGFAGGNENGFDEVTAFFDQIEMATPDLCAYEVLNFEAQGDLAKLLGKPAAEIEGWYTKSRELLARMLDKMWDGEHFVALKNFTHEPVFSGANMHYIPLLLGSRLPAQVLDKLTADLMTEGKLLSPYGLATETMDSDVFEMVGVKMGRGPVCPPGQLYIISGLMEAGKKAEARELADRYLRALMKLGYPHFIDPIHGEGSFPGGTWCRAAFLILARMMGE